MAKNEYPAPPHYPLINTQMMTARELRETLEDLWDWVHDAEMAPGSVAPPDQLIQDVRQQMGVIISERVERHSDETGRSAE
jgi:hypothetical protein